MIMVSPFIRLLCPALCAPGASGASKNARLPRYSVQTQMRTQWVWGAAQGSAFLTSSHMMPVPLALDHPKQREGAVHPGRYAGEVPRGARE